MDLHTIIRSFAALAALWFAAYYLWRDYRYDSFREDIFSLRDELFRYAARGNISFRDPAYTIMRNRMNSLLHRGHDLTITRLFLLIVIPGKTKHELTEQWERALAALPSSVREKMATLNARVAIFVFQHVVYYSLFRYLIFRLFISSINVDEVIESPSVSSKIRELESKALEDETVLNGVTTA